MARAVRPADGRCDRLQQPLGIDGGVDLRRGQRGVAEQLLDRAQVAAARQQVGGEGVAQRVRRSGLGQAERPRNRAMASWMMRGDSGPPLAPTNSGPSAGSW